MHQSSKAHYSRTIHDWVTPILMIQQNLSLSRSTTHDVVCRDKLRAASVTLWPTEQRRSVTRSSCHWRRSSDVRRQSMTPSHKASDHQRINSVIDISDTAQSPRTYWYLMISATLCTMNYSAKLFDSRTMHILHTLLFAFLIMCIVLLDIIGLHCVMP